MSRRTNGDSEKAEEIHRCTESEEDVRGGADGAKSESIPCQHESDNGRGAVALSVRGM